MFTNAIVRTPGRSIVEGLSDSKTLGLPNYEQAIIQHQSYIDVLTKCGLDVLVLEPCEEYPDSTFVEDVALITPNCVIITRPGAPSRRGEVHEIEFVLKQKFNNIEAIEAPGTIEGGDIMMVGDHYYIGLSERTNIEGAKQIIQILTKYGMSGSTISLKKVLHLKTGLSYLEENNLVVCGEFIKDSSLEGYNRIEIPEKESYAANCIWVNESVIIPLGYPTTKQRIKNAGYPVIETDVTEFQKLDGGLSCLSLRY
jgi:dimethylargininase